MGMTTPNASDVKPTLTPNDRVTAAILATAELLPEHWQKLLASRTASADACGSVCDVQRVQLDRALAAAQWEPYIHPAIMAGCSAFWTYDIPGTVGIEAIATLPESTRLELRDAHATGMVEAVIVGTPKTRALGTCLIVGEHGGREVVFTFHPGAPIRPSTVPAAGAKRHVTVSEAKAMGLEWAKVAPA